MQAAGPNLVLITLDTTRADHLGCYGYARATSPNLDRLAAESVLHTRMFANSSWTLPAHASLFTGLLPTSHGARYDPQGPLLLTNAFAGPAGWERYRARGLAPEWTTLAEALRGAGLVTGAVVAGPWMKRAFGLDRGFDFYDDDAVSKLRGARAEEVTDRALAWLEDSPPQRFFLFLNYFDPHTPYLPPPEFRFAFLPDRPELHHRELSPEVYRALYDAEILYMDHHLGRLLDGLREQGLWDSTWVVVTADHGEQLGEEDVWGHGRSLHDPEIRIPLVIREPGGRPGRSELPVQQADLPAQLLTAFGVPRPSGMPAGRAALGERPVVAELHPAPGEEDQAAWQALVEGHWKLLRNDRGERQLFDLESDPLESRDLAADRAEQALAMEQRLLAHLASLPRPAELPAGTPQTLDAETREALEGLGYVGDGAPEP